MNGAKIKRQEIELFLRDMAHHVIDDTSIVKSIVNEVFEEINLNSLHKSHKSKDEAKMELVSCTRKKTIEYLDTYSDFENNGAIKDNLNHIAKRFLKYNMYFFNKKEETYEVFLSVPELIDEQLEKLSNLEKEVLIRRYYFFQSSEKIAQALNLSMYKVYSTIRQLVKTLWSRVICNEEISGTNNMDIVALAKEIEDFFRIHADEKHVNITQKVSEKEIKEYFIIRLISGSKLSDIELLFDDICLESMSKIRPDDEEIDNLEYLRVFRHHTNTTVTNKVKRKKSLYRTVGLAACLGITTLSTLLVFGKNNVLVKASNKNLSYNASSTKLGLSFVYNKVEDNIDIDIKQNYYVNESAMPNFTDKIDTELALKVDKNNLYTDKNNVKQTVHESTSKYLSISNEGKKKYKQGDRKYVYNDVFNILFVAEFEDGVWECTKVINVDNINASSKYHLDKENVLQNFYKDSSDDLWKCELHVSGKKDIYTEIEFIRDDAKMSGLGKYKTSTMAFRRSFDQKTGDIRMKLIDDIEEEDMQDDEFITYIIDEDETVIYYNTYDDGEVETSIIGNISNNVLENITEYIKECPEKVLDNIEDYNIQIPGKEKYILPCLVQQLSDNTYQSDYYENNYYDICQMEKSRGLALEVFVSSNEDSINTYRLYDDSYFKEIKNVENYKNIMGMNSVTYFDTKINDFKIRIFNNRYVEILEYNGKKSNVTIPNYLNGYDVKYIANEAFKYNEHIKEVTIADSVIEIGKEAFKECEKLKKVVIKGNIVSIGEEAYEGCKELKEINIKKAPKYIGKDCFDGTKFIETLEEKNNVLYMGDTAIKLLSDVKELKLKLSTVAIADNFLDGHGTKLQEIILPCAVKYIGESAFEDARNVNTITMGAEVMYIGAKAFKGCAKINTIKVPSPVQVLNEETFADCIGLRMIEGATGVKVIRKNAFRGTNKECKLTISPNTACVFK